MARRRIGLRMAALFGFVIAGVVAGALIWGFWPWIDRDARLETGRPLPTASVSEPIAAAAARFLSEDARGIDAAVALEGARLAFAWGAVDRPHNLASARKSVLSVLIGIAVTRGLMDLDVRLDALGIDESETPLTAVERTATVRDLLTARSGVYLPSGAESALARRLRPERGSARPGAQFSYNNWDFNVLGVVFEQETGLSIGEAIGAWLAEPLGLQDFHPSHVFSEPSGAGSDHPTYRIFMSARDLARIGAMMLQGGVWEGRRILPEAWVRASATPYSRVGPPMTEPPYDGYGYAWWINTESGAMVASGWGGQRMIVDFAANRVLVVQNDTGAALIPHLWFRRFGARGRVQDFLTLYEVLFGR